MPWCASVWTIWSHSSCARASTSASGTSTVGAGDGRVERRLAELGLDLAVLAPRAARARMSSRSSSSVSKPAASTAKSSSSSGSSLRLTSLTATANCASLAGQVLGAVVLGERRRDRALLAGAWRPSSCSSKPGHEPPGAELDQLVAPLAAGERLAVDRAA